MFVEKCSPEMKEFCVKQDITWEEVSNKILLLLTRSFAKIEGHLIKPFLNQLESDCPGDKGKALQSMGYGTRYNIHFSPE